VPSLAALDNGGFILGWHSLGKTGTAIGVYTQRFDANGRAIGQAVLTRTYEAESQTAAVILKDRRIMMLWQDSDNDAVQGLDIFGMVFTTEGQREGLIFRVNEYLNGDQTLPVVMSQKENAGCLVCWQSNEKRSGLGRNIYARILAPPPYVQHHLDQQIVIAKVGMGYHWSFAEDTFANIDSDSVDYIVGLSNDQPLPEWLHFDDATRTFSGIPPREYEGNLQLKVTVKQGIYSIYDTVKLTIKPSLTATNLDQSILYREEKAFSAISIVSEVSSTASVSITLSDPALGRLSESIYNTASSTYDEVTGMWEVSGNIEDVNYFLRELNVERNDPNFRGDSTLFITIDDGINNSLERTITMQGNRAPRLVNPTADQEIGIGTRTVIDLSNTFIDNDNEDSLALSVERADGKALDKWIKLKTNPHTKELTLEPKQVDTGTFDLLLHASDGLLRATDRFKLVLVYTLQIYGVRNAQYTEDEILPLPVMSFGSSVSSQLSANLTLSDPKAGSISSNVITAHSVVQYNGDLGQWQLTAPISEANEIYQNVRFIPAPDYDRDVSLMLEVDDGVQKRKQIITLEAQAVNDPPRFKQHLEKLLISSNKLFEFEQNSNVYDPEGDDIELTARLSDGSELPEWLQFKNGTFTGMPSNNDRGIYEVVIIASDGRASVSEPLIIQVEKLNQDKKETPVGLIVGLSVGFVILVAGSAIALKVYKTRRVKKKLAEQVKADLEAGVGKTATGETPVSETTLLRNPLEQVGQPSSTSRLLQRMRQVGLLSTGWGKPYPAAEASTSTEVSSSTEKKEIIKDKNGTTRWASALKKLGAVSAFNKIVPAPSTPRTHGLLLMRLNQITEANEANRNTVASVLEETGLTEKSDAAMADVEANIHQVAESADPCGEYVAHVEEEVPIAPTIAAEETEAGQVSASPFSFFGNIAAKNAELPEKENLLLNVSPD